MKEIGKWVNKNGAAIYGTRSTKNYQDGNTWFTQNEKEGLRYAMVCIPEGQAVAKEITWQNNVPKKGSKMKILQTGQTVKWKAEGNSVSVSLPASIVSAKEPLPALAFAFTPVE